MLTEIYTYKNSTLPKLLDFKSYQPGYTTSAHILCWGSQVGHEPRLNHNWHFSGGMLSWDASDNESDLVFIGMCKHWEKVDKLLETFQKQKRS